MKVFRNGNTPEAYSWKGNKWELIGEVMSEANPQSTNAPQASQPKYYPGDKFFPPGEYDHLFNVEDESESGSGKVIPFNNGDNALVAAEKYCKREGINRGYLEQIRKFLSVNSSTVPTQKISEETQGPEELTSLPNRVFIEFEGIGNVNGLRNKLFEFNDKINEPLKLNQAEKNHI